MNILPVLILGICFFYLIEPLMKAQPLPQYRHRHAIVNIVMTTLNVVVLAGVGLGITAIALWSTKQGLGIGPFLERHEIVSPAAVFVLIVLLYDFSNYGIHRSQHVFKKLWRLHRTHHTDPYLDVTSAFRFHPFESIYRGAIQGITVIVLGMSVQQIAAYLILVVAALLFSHANIKLPSIIDKTLGLLLVTPDLHRVHHSVERRFHDSNYGIVLIIWDRLLGTLTKPETVEVLTIGLTEYPTAERLGVKELLKDPFAPAS